MPQYNTDLGGDLAEEVEEQRSQLGISKSDAARRALSQWVDDPTLSERARAHAVNAAGNLALVAVVVFITGEVTSLLTVPEGVTIAWVLLALAGGIIASAEVAALEAVQTAARSIRHRRRST